MKTRAMTGAAFLAVTLALTSFAPGARADTISYTIGVPNAALSAFTGPYATVSVNRTDSTHAIITFDSLSNGGYLYLLGGADSGAINVNATTFSIVGGDGGISGSNSVAGHTVGTYSSGSGNVSDFGNMNLSIKTSDGFNDSSTKIFFTLLNASGTWATAGSVLTANSDGFLAAVHAFACLNPCANQEGAANTGFAGNSSVAVPGPIVGAGLPGLLLASAGLMAWLRRRKQLQLAA